MTDRNAKFDAAVNRLLRTMAITQVSVSTEPPVALFDLNLPAMAEAICGVRDLIDTGAVPATYVVKGSQQVIGSSTADLLAESISTPCPDTLEGL